MNLGIFLSSGDSLTDMEKYGQADRFKSFYLKYFADNFDNIYLFSYENEKISGLPRNVKLVGNRYKIHRWLYNLLIPFLEYKNILKCDVFRAYHLSGTFPAIVTKIFFLKPFVFNYGYDYREFVVVEKKYFQYILLTLVHPLACFFAERIIAVTKAVLKWTPKEKTVFIPNGVDTKVFKPLRKLNSKRLKVINIGRLETQKNQLNLVKSLKGLPVDLLIIGRGSLKNQILKLAKDLKVNVKIIDRVDNTKLPKMYNQADIFALPSITEGPVKVLLEAMACGLPVVGSKVNGIKEILKDNVNGIFCSTEVKSIRRAIVKLVSSRELRVKIGDNARQYMVENFELLKLLHKEVLLIKGASKND